MCTIHTDREVLIKGLARVQVQDLVSNSARVLLAWVALLPR
jgi:hypothetical protein